jgi:outer membrane protein assembly factor BamA
MKDLTFTGAGRSFSSAKSYDAAIERVRPDGTTLAQYDKLDILRPYALYSIERSLLGGVLRPFVGLGFSYNQVRDYSGRSVAAVDDSGANVHAIQGPTRLKEDCDAGRIVGCHGGWENILRVALAFDTRDFEPDPNSGLFAEVSSEIGARALGSRYEYVRVLGVVRGYYSPLPSLADVVIAGRALYEMQSRGTPFFSMNALPFTEDGRYGLGGVRTLRGYRQDRFVGPVMALANLEVRWTFYRFTVKSENFALFLVPFLDMGRVWDNVASTSLRDWKRGQGAGRASASI